MFTAPVPIASAFLFTPDADVGVDDLHLDADHSIHIALRSSRATAACPLCEQDATRVHSIYTRSVVDLAWRGFPVDLALRVRRFRCARAECPRVLFAERFGVLVAPYARRTTRLNHTLTRVGMALGGEAGARILPHLGVSASADTILRRVHRAPSPSTKTPRVLGVDDWARRRGHTYGTVLVDLEAHTPVDLLSDREAASFAKWLREHPGVEVVARDRAETYAQGAREGAPEAMQVADRWHLLKNVGELLERLLHAHRTELAHTAAAVSLPTTPSRVDAVPVRSASATSPVPPVSLAEREAPRGRDATVASPAPSPAAGRQAARQALYDQVHALRAEGLSLRAIGARVGASVPTVRKYLRAPTCPTRAPRRTKVGTLTRFDSHLRARWNEGCQDALVLWSELRAMGFQGSLRTVQRHVERWRGPNSPADAPRPPKSPTARSPSPRQARWWLLLPSERLSEDQRRFVVHLTESCEPIRAARQLAVEFGRLIRARDVPALEPWLAQAETSELAAFRDFAAGLRREHASIEAAVREPWSNGQTEGQVNKLKMLKRQMYGRASVPLLRQRMLNAT